MVKFKDWALKLALDKQIPIIPVTLSYNPLILPEDRKFLLRHKPVNVILHEPILVERCRPKEVKDIKRLCFSVIQGLLDKDNNSLVNKKDNS